MQSIIGKFLVHQISQIHKELGRIQQRRTHKKIVLDKCMVALAPAIDFCE